MLIETCNKFSDSIHVEESCRIKTIMKRISSRLTVEDQGTAQVAPETKLWARALEMGTREALKGDREAIRWLNNNNSQETGSILWVCEQVEFPHLQELREVVNTGDMETRSRLLKKLQ